MFSKLLEKEAPMETNIVRGNQAAIMTKEFS